MPNKAGAAGLAHPTPAPEGFQEPAGRGLGPEPPRTRMGTARHRDTPTGSARHYGHVHACAPPYTCAQRCAQPGHAPRAHTHPHVPAPPPPPDLRSPPGPVPDPSGSPHPLPASPCPAPTPLFAPRKVTEGCAAELRRGFACEPNEEIRRCHMRCADSWPQRMLPEG
ncbi:basic proline-rich protein-like [Numida meleagris]|uniref:basic proline-rich protein-like n=1 Tax=Numida meleagris TaxID=8996 RepID=UPI000B3E1F92|nr:basic proline-rich protein-like [Numida meleagris]